MKPRQQSTGLIIPISTRKTTGKIAIRVSDNGNGSHSSIISRIFQAFFTTNPAGQDTGLGLSLSSDIVTKGHGGERTVETQEGAGTTFITHLPDKALQ
jgi:two-component system, NtrC family, sensor kinase